MSLTVPGPASSSLPVVSIVASATPVTEGTAAAFTLSRTGATDAALTVTVSVSESEASVSGTPPTSVTFAAASASATLSVATEDDEVATDAALTVTATATVSSGSGYTVSGTSGSADVVVADDDATPVVTTASPIVVAENATSVATLSATDADTAAADLSWSIPAGAAGGADAAQFALTADGVLSFRAAKDYEAPDDADTDGEYEVTVRVTDGANPVDAALVVRLSDVDDVAPVLSSASVDGAVLTLTFGEALDADSVAPESSFAVTVGGSTRAVDAVAVSGSAVSGSAVTLTLSAAVETGDTVTVDYTVPTGESANKLQDASGNTAESFSGQAVTNNTSSSATPRTVPTPAPGAPNSLKVARHESGKLLASWNAPDSGPASTGYTVQWKESADDWDDADDVSVANVKGTSHVITGLTDGVEYAVRVVARKGDAAGDPSGEVTATPQETVAPSPSAATVDGATLTITFDEPLDAGEFSLRGDGGGQQPGRGHRDGVGQRRNADPGIGGGGWRDGDGGLHRAHGPVNEQVAGHVWQRRGLLQRAGGDQQHPGGGPADRQRFGRARVPKWGVHLRAAFQRDTQEEVQLQDHARPRLHSHRRPGDQGPEAGPAQQRGVGDPRPAGRGRGRDGDHRAARHHGLHGGGRHLHPGRQETVQPPGDHRAGAGRITVHQLEC